MREKIRIGIVEDDVSVRSLVVEYLSRDPKFEWVIVAGSVEDFFQNLADDQIIDVLLQDIGLPGVSGLEGIRTVKEKLPSTQVIMFSVYDDSNRIFKALCAGASGYLLKNTRLEDIKKSIETVHNGQAAMSPAIAKKVIAYFQPKKPESPLTEKEQLVVQLLTDGLSYKMIAGRLQISINTVGTHIRNIYKKLQVNSKAEVISKKLRGDI